MALKLPFTGDKKSAESLDLAGSTAAALLIDADGRMVSVSSTGAGLQALWQQQVAPLVQLVDYARAGQVAEDRVELSAGPSFWVVALPHTDGVLLVLRDITVADRMTDALMASRSLLKTLLERAADLSFEVDGNKRLSFLSPADIHGVAAKPWVGAPVEDFFFSDGELPGRSPFAGSEERVYPGVKTRLPDGILRWMDIDIAPKTDENGQIAGMLGVARDVTEARQRERDARQVTLRLSLEGKLTAILNASKTAEELVDKASDALADFVRADVLWFVGEADGAPMPLSVRGERPLDFDALCRQLDGVDLASDTGHVVEYEDADGVNYLIIPLLAEDPEEGDKSRLGFVVLGRDSGAYPWSEAERSLLASLSATLTAAYGRAQLIDQLSRLSSLDGLTELLNRRALTDAINRRLRNQARTGHEGVLLFIDLDHFKEVNDTVGHKAGDQALTEVSAFVKSNIRPLDVAGRYGGDEFIIWLEDTALDDARAKGQALIDFMPEIRRRIGNTSLKLGASVGLCQSAAGLDRDFDSLAERADAALYEVKKHGRGAIAVADRLSEKDV